MVILSNERNNEMIGHEIRFSHNHLNTNVSVDVSFSSHEEALAFMSAVSKLLVTDTEKEKNKLKENVLNVTRNRGASTGSLIELIKSYRQITNSGLKESKDWVEANFSHMINRHPY